MYLAYNLITGKQFGKPDLSSIPEWVFTLYNISHSLFVAFGVIILLYAILRKFPWYALAWPIAIVMDLFTHTRDFLPTPFLWPVSSWRFDGISWGSRWFIIANYAAIAVAFIVIYAAKKRRERAKPITPPSP